MDLREAFYTLRLPSDLVDPVVSSPSEDSAQTAWLGCLTTIRKIYKQLAFELHPDRGGDQAAFVRLQEAWRLINTVDIREIWRRAQAPVQVETVTLYMVGFTGSGTSATTTSGFGVFEMRPPVFIRRT